MGKISRQAESVLHCFTPEKSLEASKWEEEVPEDGHGTRLFEGQNGRWGEDPWVDKAAGHAATVSEASFCDAIPCAAGHLHSASSCPGGDRNLCPSFEDDLGLLPVAIYEHVIIDLQERGYPWCF